MDRQDLLRQIEDERPGVILLSGKSATGKSTLSKQIAQQFGYEAVELDSIVCKEFDLPQTPEIDSRTFWYVYRAEGPAEYMQRFVKALAKCVRDRKNHLVLEGSVASVELLDAIFKVIPGSFLFAHLHPADQEAYIKRISERLAAASGYYRGGLPKDLWDEIPEENYNQFRETGEMAQVVQEAIKKYTAASARESQHRFERFKEHHSSVIEVSV